MKPCLLNSIALEPNRWTHAHIPRYTLLSHILPQAMDAGFRDFELWQFHLTRIDNAEFRALHAFVHGHELQVPIVGAYPKFELEGLDAIRELDEQRLLFERAKAIGAQHIKFFFGRVAASALTAAQLERTEVQFEHWYRQGQAAGFVFFVETHEKTLLDPLEAGLKIIELHPTWKLDYCYQPYDFSNTQTELKTIDRLGSGIGHVHFQGRDAQRNFCLLQDAAIDYRQIVSRLKRYNADFWPSIEFVRNGFPAPGEELNFAAALKDAQQDACYLSELLQ